MSGNGNHSQDASGVANDFNYCIKTRYMENSNGGEINPVLCLAYNIPKTTSESFENTEALIGFINQSFRVAFCK